jgi:putative acetyltransferase
MPSPIHIRPETPPDASAVRQVNEQAFGRAVEADLVDALRDAGAAILSLVAETDGEVVGHVLFSPLAIETATGTREAVALAPLAVVPERQRQGIGTRLVEDGLARLRDGGHGAVVVIGHAAYYPRFGFQRARPWGLEVEFEVPDEAFMALELVPGALAGCAGTVRYRPEFDGA